MFVNTKSSIMSSHYWFTGSNKGTLTVRMRTHASLSRGLTIYVVMRIVQNTCSSLWLTSLGINDLGMILPKRRGVKNGTLISGKSSQTSTRAASRPSPCRSRLVPKPKNFVLIVKSTVWLDVGRSFRTLIKKLISKLTWKPRDESFEAFDRIISTCGLL